MKLCARLRVLWIRLCARTRAGAELPLAAAALTLALEFECWLTAGERRLAGDAREWP
jgi:hypothetical protein